MSINIDGLKEIDGYISDLILLRELVGKILCLENISSDINYIDFLIIDFEFEISFKNNMIILLSMVGDSNYRLTVSGKSIVTKDTDVIFHEINKARNRVFDEL